jgi:hypothetical protein
MKFPLGQIYTSREVDALLSQSPDFCTFVSHSLSRHKAGDWGDCCSEDKQANDRALNGSDRLFSVYLKDDVKIWIITEWDRSVTTILFPHEY